jgi:hypothetical protein
LIGASRHDIIDAGTLFKYIEVKQSGWKSFIETSDDSKEVSVIRKFTTTGRPLGNNTFVQRLEKMFGERLHALPVGRPKKMKGEK